MSVTITAGKVAVVMKGDWRSDTAYEKLDEVQYQGKSYRARIDVPAGTPLSNTAYWVVSSERGEKGDQGIQGERGVSIEDVDVDKTGTAGNVDTYTMTVSLDDGSQDTDEFDVTNGSVTSVNGRTGDVTGLSEQDGYYEEMTVGSAEELFVEDTTNNKFYKTRIILANGKPVLEYSEVTSA